LKECFVKKFCGFGLMKTLAAVPGVLAFSGRGVGIMLTPWGAWE
jgi:hypothetical protein